ncbi:hypothetical protein ACFV1L_13140 [Kitasatospora sp. NPDC059646]|uniref:hypothetical protein n=1 Tax=Kitasatospora sp. NPDC059646 TaxID=3346893 RepID=UPI0036D20023
MTTRHLVRFGAVALCVASIALAQTTAASAASRTVNFSFKYKLDSRTWDQKYGKATFAITDCNGPNQQFHVELIRDRWNGDTRLEGHNLKCAKGVRADFYAPEDGEYFLRFTKLDDDTWFTGTAVISFTS